MNENLVSPTAWVRLYHASGAQVTIPLPLEKDQISAVVSSLDALLQAGLAVTMPGTEAGELTEPIAHIVRRAKTNSDRTETPLIDLYPTRANFRLLGLYLNDGDQLSTFEKACGVRLDDLPLYDGDSPIERGKNPKLEKFVFSLPHAVPVVYRPNPRWDGEGDKKNPKRVFVRWLGGTGSPKYSNELDSAKGTLCPVGTKSNPETRGMPLGQVAEMMEGRKLLQYLAGEQYQPNGDPGGQKAKNAARLLLTTMPAEV